MLRAASRQTPGDEALRQLLRRPQEIIDARVWGGIHFRTADVQGAAIGRKVARYVRKHYFNRVH